MTQVAAVAEEQDHHPDWSNSWNRVVIELRSHDAGAVTERDHRLAEAIDRIADEFV
jgi:4a-hydroxytetrahydrobiopterin dehydratase